MSDILHMPPIREPRRFWMGLFGACAAPVFWISQLMLGYWFTSAACYGSDHPTTLNDTGLLRSMLTAFDVIAIVACAVGAILSYLVLRSTAHRQEVRDQVQGRVRFLGIWGLLSSLWFFAAILFNTIASLGVPLCAR